MQSATSYIFSMGTGINSDACKTRPARRAVDARPEYYQAFKDRGFDHIRLQIVNDITYDQLDERGALVGGDRLLDEIGMAVNDSLAAGLMPIVAYSGGLLEEDVTVAHEDMFVEWWIKCSDYLRHISNLAAFNLMIEIGNPLQEYPDIVNRAYKRVIAYIRKTQPQRVIFCAPVMLSEARKLHLLDLPEDDPFLAVEVHDYASGPIKDPTHAKYWNELDPDPAVRLANRQRFRDTLDIAVGWSQTTHIPVWFGAILAAPYNKNGGVFTPAEQAEFASFVMDECEERGIPVAWNSDDKFIDMATMEFRPEQDIVLDAILGEQFND